MAKANLQLIYVSDIEYSTVLYTNLLDEPLVQAPRYVAFKSDNEGKCLFALWSGAEPNKEAVRSSEIGIMLDSDHEVDESFDAYKDLPGISVLKKPYTDVFGRTYLLRDPDGHLIRVCSRD